METNSLRSKIKITEIAAEKILAGTSIDLAEYVINPYRGCVFACGHCYVKENQQIKRRAEKWGSFVDVKINAPDLLKKQIAAFKPKSVLIGSTTDPFQPIEKKYRLTQKIMEILAGHKIPTTIMTCSPLIAETADNATGQPAGYLKILKKMAARIYFSVIDQNTWQEIAPFSPKPQTRWAALKVLNETGIKVIPYLCPVVFGLINLDEIFQNLGATGLKNLEVENLKFLPENQGLARLERLGSDNTGDNNARHNQASDFEKFVKTFTQEVLRRALPAGIAVKFHWNPGQFFEAVSYQ